MNVSNLNRGKILIIAFLFFAFATPIHAQYYSYGTDYSRTNPSRNTYTYGDYYYTDDVWQNQNGRFDADGHYVRYSQRDGFGYGYGSYGDSPQFVDPLYLQNYGYNNYTYPIDPYPQPTYPPAPTPPTIIYVSVPSTTSSDVVTETNIPIYVPTPIPAPTNTTTGSTNQQNQENSAQSNLAASAISSGYVFPFNIFGLTILLILIMVLMLLFKRPQTELSHN